MSTHHHKERLTSLFQELAATFLQRESSGASLITVTRVIMTDNLRSADVLVTVLPADKEAAAVDFLKRQRQDFRDYVKSHARVKHVPMFDFAIDEGEKRRQRLDELS